MKCKYDIVLFDLDGTISESGAGIQQGMYYALKSLGIPAQDFTDYLNDYSNFVGPPIQDTFKILCQMNKLNAENALKYYVQFYDEQGKHLNKMYKGIDDVLKELHKSDARVVLCSSKRQKAAEEVVELLKLRKYFDALCGSEDNGWRSEKKDNIPYAIQSVGGSLNNKIVMIGDTKYDAEGARLARVDFIGVLYGYGTKEQMEKEGASVFAEHPLDLMTLLF